MQLGDIVQRRRVRRQRVGLPVLDHLETVLDRAEAPVGVGQQPGILAVDPLCFGKCGERIQSRGGAQLRLAAWRASRFGLDCELLDPQLNALRDARQVARSLFEYVRPVLAEQGEDLMVESLLRQSLIRGTGSNRQRAVYARTGSLAEVVSDAVFLTNLGGGSLHERHADNACFHMRGNELHRI